MRRIRNRAPCDGNRAVALRRRRRLQWRRRRRCRRNFARTIRTPVVVAGFQLIIISSVCRKIAGVDIIGSGDVSPNPRERSPARRRSIQFVMRRLRNRAPCDGNRAVALRRRDRRGWRDRCDRRDGRNGLAAAAKITPSSGQAVVIPYSFEFSIVVVLAHKLQSDVIISPQC